MTVIDPPYYAGNTVSNQELFKRMAKPKTEQQAIDAIVASQKANGEPIDPNGARKLVRALIAVGLFKPA